MASTSIKFDAHRFSRLIGMGYEASRTPAMWRRFADELARQSHSQLAMLQYIEDQHPERSFLVCGGLGDEFEVVFAETSWLSEEDRFWAEIRSQPPGTVKLASEIMDPKTMRRTPSYARVARPWKLEHFLISAVTTGNGISAFLSLGRTRNGAPFVEGDKTLFGRMVVSHLQRGIAIHHAFTSAAHTNALLSAVVDMTPYGVVVFDNRGRPIVVNERARRMFANNDGLALINGHLHASDPAAHALLENSLSISLHGALGNPNEPPDPVFVPRKNKPQPYQVLFSQLNLGEEPGNLPAGSAAMALVHDRWMTGSEYLPVLLRGTYRMTRAEIRLCQALLAGKTLPEAARELNISRNTAKTHLTRVFDKTGVRSQASLLSLLAGGRQA